MPYEWTPLSDRPGRRLLLWPYRSLPRRGFAATILGLFVLITIPLYGVIGTMLLWGLLPFAMAAVGALWWGLERSYKDAEILEELILTPELAQLTRTEPRGDRKEWECNSYWTQVTMHAHGGPVPHYVTLKGSGREVEIGAFLSEPERKALYVELDDALRDVNRPVG
ncbi:DUF2244 domain-containing protein [Mesobacterium pallidum]|uniref:DUF2244 domain-containing protein n=1 Tax=Mesobacterium pallidum TaxID=2872037 RepID=UPI001EE29A58|nr:DUF2244 domain-containing protein [Mesobacterium pallidum]